jgi:cob(I)alamin adenosyltransferase
MQQFKIILLLRDPYSFFKHYKHVLNKSQGATDELNSHIGLAREHAVRDGLVDITLQLEEIMSRMFDVGAAIATPLSSSAQTKVSFFCAYVSCFFSLF